MKKYSLTLILVLCLFVITGGTYAAWTYYNGYANPNSSSEGSIAIEALGQESSKGDITITNSALTIKLDKNDSDYSGKLVGSGSMTVTLNNAGQPGYTALGALEIAVTVTDASGTLSSNSSTYAQITGSTIEASDVIGLITVSPEFSLNTKADYDKFAESFAPTITITVREVGSGK